MTLLSNMAKKSFEEALARLEEITAELEDGELSLEKSLKKFDEGIKLADFCNTQLTEAKAKVEILLERDGRLESTPFAGADGGDQTLPE
jgi:exodeoxyribonuclease VII small subunit